MHKENLKKEMKKRLEIRCNIIVTIMDIIVTIMDIIVTIMATPCLVAFCVSVIQEPAAQNINMQTKQPIIKRKPSTTYFAQNVKDLNVALDKHKINVDNAMHEFRVGNGYIGLHKAARENNLHVRQ